MAYQGKYQEAAKIHVRCGNAKQYDQHCHTHTHTPSTTVPKVTLLLCCLFCRAIAMFTDLRMWDDAKKVAKNAGMDVQALIAQQAKWAEEVGDNREAATLYMASGQHMKAAVICGERGWLNELMEVARVVDKTNTEVLKKCAEFCRQRGNHKFAKEVYIKMDDIQSLMEVRGGVTKHSQQQRRHD